MLYHPVTQWCPKFSVQGEYGAIEERDQRCSVPKESHLERKHSLGLSQRANWLSNGHNSSRRLTLTKVLQNAEHGFKVNPEGI